MSAWSIIEWDSALRIIEVVALVIMAICMLYLRANFATRKEVAVISGDVRNVLARVDMVEHDFKRMPSAEVISHLREEMSKLAANLSALREGNESTARAVTRIEDHLLRSLK